MALTCTDSLAALIRTTAYSSTLMIVMPSWQLGAQTANPEDKSSVAVELGSNSTADASALVGATKDLPESADFAQGRELPVKIVVIEGQHVSLNMPNVGELPPVAANGVFAANRDGTTDVTQIRGLKPSVGTLEVDQGNRGKVEIQVVVVSDPTPLRTKLDDSGFNHITITPGVQCVTLTGEVSTPDEKRRCASLAGEFFPDAIIDIRVQTARTAPKVVLHCRIFEFTVDDESGVNAALDLLFQGGKRWPRSIDGMYSSVLDGEAFFTRFDDLRKSVKAKMISSPDLVAGSGQHATVQYGEKYPILLPLATEGLPWST